MSSKSVTKMCAAAGLVGGLSLAASMVTASCGQPRMWCTSAHGDFAVKLTLKDSSDDDAQCAQLKGDVVGLDTYSGTLPDGNPDFANSQVALAAATLGDIYQAAIGLGVASPDDGPSTVALGDFDQEKPAGDNFCTAGGISAAELSVPEVPAEDPEDDGDTGETGEEDYDDTGETGDTGDDDDDDDLPPLLEATDMTIEWEDFKILVTPDAQGTQFSATMKIEWNDCTATYEAVGVYPAVHCESDEDCGDTSGINPDFAVECDADIGLCVLSGPPPSYE